MGTSRGWDEEPFLQQAADELLRLRRPESHARTIGRLGKISSRGVGRVPFFIAAPSPRIRDAELMLREEYLLHFEKYWEHRTSRSTTRWGRFRHPRRHRG
jgi:hypothetical protein